MYPEKLVDEANSRLDIAALMIKGISGVDERYANC